jgi:cytochrome b6-f complex iron-sulfur subunit
MSLLALSTGTVAVLLVLVVLNVFAIIFGLSFLRTNRAARAAASGEPVVAPPALAMTRRDFFRRSLITSLLVFGAEFGGGTIAFLWPNLRGGFGSNIPVGGLADIKAAIVENGGQYYVGAGRFYIVEWDGTPGDGQADYPALGVTLEGIMPLYQRCVHLGCRVPFCGSSKWFECPCHGSKYNGVGEYELGPAPRGMDRFHVTVEGDVVVVDTSTVVLGPPRGTDTIGQQPQGAFCVATG